MDFSKHTVDELKELQDRISRELKMRADQDAAAARDQIIAIAKAAGISLHDLVGSAAKVKANVKVAAKYRHPENASLEWTGRGRQPRWVVEFLATGKKLAELGI